MSASSIPAAFAEAVSRHAKRVALTDGRRTNTYAELGRRAHGIASWLRRRGVGPGQYVGLFANRSIEAIAAILGVLETGAAYVPFDPSYPSKLLQFIYDDSRPAAMLVQKALFANRAGTEFWRGDALILDESTGLDLQENADVQLPPVSADDPAYVMYTSGSTGRPKGVIVPHRGVLRLVIDNDFAHVGPDETFLQLAPLSFDASTFEIWGALLNGGRLAVFPGTHPSLEEIAAAIAAHGVTTLWLTAGLFHLMVDNQLEGLKPLRQLLAGGDVLSPAHVARARRGLPGCRLVNGYGPTENTTFTCCYTIETPLDEAPIPIGKPIRQTTVRILDEARMPVVPGLEGELYVGGAGLAIGYLNRPELDAERFVTDPFDSDPHARLYKTGDRVRMRPDGHLEFLGRVDRQVKIDGKRVELDEIEARLRTTGLVQDAAVICTSPPHGTKQIHAFVTAPGGLDVERLKARLREELPDYMIPASITRLEALPLSPTGKVERTKLQVPAAQTPADGSRPPADDTEAALREIWCRVLGRRSVGLEDNFFDLGGTSLGLIEVHASIRRSMGSDITVVEMFQYPRISALAQRMRLTPAPRGALHSAKERAQRQQAALARRPGISKIPR